MTARHRPFVSLTGKGFCQVDARCLRRAGHEGKCWPCSADREIVVDMLTEDV